MIRIATVGTGWIVGEFLRGAKEVPEVEYLACYSRTRERGELFAREWGAQKVYTDLEQMAQDDAIDAVYIASPNSLHYEQSKLFYKTASTSSVKSLSRWNRNSWKNCSSWHSKNS